MFKYDLQTKGYYGEFYEASCQVSGQDDPDNSYANILFQMQNNSYNPILS